jgi:hypothetical protein
VNDTQIILDLRLAIRKLTTVMNALVYFDRAGLDSARSNDSFGATRSFARCDHGGRQQSGLALDLQI